MKGMQRYVVKHIGRSLQKARKKAGYKSAKAYACHLGLNRSTYTGYEQGIHKPPIDVIYCMACDLNITIDELCGYPVDLDSSYDEKQEELNVYYELLDEQSKSEIVGFLKSLAADPARRIVKEGQEALQNKSGMDKTA